MVETLKELNAIVQKPHYKTRGNLMVRYILRDAALPLTWLLLHTSVTANQVTLVSMLIGLLGILFLSFQGAGYFLGGALLLQLWYYLDHVDGQIARYRKTSCLSGRFFDFLTHHVIHAPIFFALGVYLWRSRGGTGWIFFGAMLSFLMMLFNMLHDIKAKAFIEKLSQGRSFKVVAAAETETPAQSEEEGLSGRKIFSWLHKACEIHVLMNVLTVTALLEAFWLRQADFRFLLFVFYAAVVPMLSIIKLSYVISRRKIDEEFSASFQ